ncbi:glycosyltransferase [Salipaludibacillus agaradhaerens]|uniref:glycosyltransferase n=1 Tax=Salipaludibacillus agaradhaerens TaxID=76935 RepID=UPI0021508A5E|nr:glycosyltransferase [Salipaludibacillus agaradhaerens]MCR6106821.1 glycosyltransferase [Salipaludibacillus agaradhaerens]MCR6118853.1 glycosyltransferase [Salipaludibacillus agaradhaerens]
MKKILLASFDMEVGGVERSLIHLLNHFNLEDGALEVFLYRHAGDFLDMLPDHIALLPEVKEYTSFRKSIKTVMQEKQFRLAISRLKAKIVAEIIGKKNHYSEPGYVQMQRMWQYALNHLPSVEKTYDVAISYLWPHYFVAEKVTAKKKIAWIHTDFSTVETDEVADETMWNKFDHIMAVSKACKEAFLTKYPRLAQKVMVLENLQSPTFIRQQALMEDPELMMEDPRFKLVTVARLSHAKGIDMAVDALAHLKEKGHTDIVWYIVGYGGDESVLRDKISQHDLHDHIILLGKKTNPYPYMQAADLYVQPSRYEGKAVTVGEAQILGKPVLITAYPTSASQVTHGKDGWICELSAEGIAEGILTLKADPILRKALSAACLQSDYSNVQELEKLYKVL